MSANKIIFFFLIILALILAATRDKESRVKRKDIATVPVVESETSSPLPMATSKPSKLAIQKCTMKQESMEPLLNESSVNVLETPQKFAAKDGFYYQNIKLQNGRSYSIILGKCVGFLEVSIRPWNMGAQDLVEQLAKDLSGPHFTQKGIDVLDTVFINRFQNETAELIRGMKDIDLGCVRPSVCVASQTTEELRLTFLATEASR